MEKKTILQNPISKFIIYTIVIISIYIGLQTILNPISLQFSLATKRLLVNPIIDFTILLALYLAYKYLWLKLENKPFTEFKDTNLLKTIFFGIGFIVLFASVIFGALYFNGNLNIQEGDGIIVLLDLLVFSLSTAFAEEIVFRGILFRIVEENLGSIISIFLSSFLFGLAHYFNPNATILSSICIGLEAGLALSALYILTRNLWMPIIAHGTWNFLQSNMGLPVSGNIATKGFFRSTLTGNELITGGEFGVEFSILVIGLGISIGTYLLYKANIQNKIIKPYWKQKTTNA